MLSIFFVIFGIIGVFLNWPIIKKGIFQQLTIPWDVNILAYVLGEYSPGFCRLDGDIVIGLSVIILISAFLHTTKTLLNLRTIMFAIIAAILCAEMFNAFNLGLPFYSYTGLLYSTFFFLCAFIASIFKLGSMKSLNSTFLGKPVSESKVFSQTFSKALNYASTVSKIKLIAQDNIKAGWAKGEERELPGSEIRVGRDEQWANLVVGNQWSAVSAKHGILRIIGQSIVYEPLSGHYSFAVDGSPYKEAKELPDHSTLTLVSGYGPSLKIARSLDMHSRFHPQTLRRAGEIAVDEFKKLQATFKILIIMVLLGLPLLLISLELQKKPVSAYISTLAHRSQRLNQELKEKTQAIDRLNQYKRSAQIQMEQFKQRIRKLKKQEKANELEIRRKKAELERFKNRVMEKIAVKELEHIAKVINIKFCSQNIAVYFPVITFFPGGDIIPGTGLFAKKKHGNICLVNQKKVVFDDKEKKWGESFFFIYPHTWEQFSRYDEMIKKRKISNNEFRQEMLKFSRLHNLMTVSGSQWRKMNTHIDANGIVTSDIKDFPDYLLEDIPGIDYQVSILDHIIFYGFHEGRPVYSPGLVSDTSESTLEANISIDPGFTGGFLVKVRSGGDYSLIGISHSSSKGGVPKRVVFLRFK